MLNASPKKDGTISGFSVPTQPMCAYMTYRGRLVTWAGIIIAARTTRKTPSLPHQRSRASA